MFARNTGIILVIVATAVASMAAISYEYASYSSDHVSAMATKAIESATQRQVHDLSSDLADRINSVDNNLGNLAKDPVFQNSVNVETAKQTLIKSQDATSGITDFYMWLDSSGHMVWLSNISSQNYQQYKNADLSYRPYFTEPKSTHSLYYSTSIISNDNIPRVFLSEPILDSNGNFNGVIVGAIRLDDLGKFLQSQITPGAQGSVGMLDKNGVILYSDDLNAIGQNVFGDSFQKSVPADLKPGFNAFLHQSLTGGSGVQELTYRGVTGTYAYNTVTVDGKDFGVLFVTTAHAITGTVTSVIDQQRLVNIILIVAIGALAAGISIFVLSLNKRLQLLVQSRTTELQKTVASLENANDRLSEHDKMQQEFVNIAAHELRTPIQPLLGMTETMQMAIKDNPRRTIELSEEEVDMLGRNVKRLETLTQNILDVTRIESKSLKLSKENIDLNVKIMNVINEVLGKNGRLVNNAYSTEYSSGQGRFEQAKTITILFHASDEPMLVKGDAARLFQVVANLLRNAIKFTKDGGTIEISSAKTANQTVVVQVKDSGIGIDSDILPRLFTKFTSGSQNGTGLGLYLSKAIIEAHGGKIWAENNPEERGATFYFSLPLTLSVPNRNIVSEDKN